MKISFTKIFMMKNVSSRSKIIFSFFFLTKLKNKNLYRNWGSSFNLSISDCKFAIGLCLIRRFYQIQEDSRHSMCELFVEKLRFSAYKQSMLPKLDFIQTSLNNFNYTHATYVHSFLPNFKIAVRLSANFIEQAYYTSFFILRKLNRKMKNSGYISFLRILLP